MPRDRREWAASPHDLHQNPPVYLQSPNHQRPILLVSAAVFLVAVSYLAIGGWQPKLSMRLRRRRRIGTGSTGGRRRRRPMRSMPAPLALEVTSVGADVAAYLGETSMVTQVVGILL